MENKHSFSLISGQGFFCLCNGFIKGIKCLIGWFWWKVTPCMFYRLWFPQTSHHVSQQTQWQLLNGYQGFGTHSPPQNHTPKVSTTKRGVILSRVWVVVLLLWSFSDWNGHQRSVVCTVSKSMIYGEIEYHGELVMVERLEEAQGRRVGCLWYM